MFNNIVLIPAYFAPIAQYAAVLQAKTTWFEAHDNFEKQTYRSRCYVYAANGKLLLNVPVQKTKGQKTLTTHTEINYAEDWQSLHLKSLQSAYRSSPFFEFYQDDLISIFKTKFVTLKELHQACHKFVMDALQEDLIFKTTCTYSTNYTDKVDCRSLTDTKQKLPITFSKYTQVFDDKHGFIENLSILDLIFMEGPSASMYLEKINLKDVFY